MKTSQSQDEKIAKMTFSSVYPHYVAKVEKKGRTISELHQVISWLTGYSENEIQHHIENNASFKTFFEQASINSNATLIKGTICGYKVEEIDNQLTRHVRYLDKLINELAKGKAMNKILRQ